MTRSKLTRYIDPRLPLTWIIGSITAIIVVVFGLYMTLKETERRSLDNEAAIAKMEVQQQTLNTGIQDMQIQLKGVGGDIKNVETKIDLLRTLMNMQTITKVAAGKS